MDDADTTLREGKSLTNDHIDDHREDEPSLPDSITWNDRRGITPEQLEQEGRGE